MKHAEVVIARRAVEEGRGLVVIVNKMDLLKGKGKSNLYKQVLDAVPEEIQTVIPQVRTLKVPPIVNFLLMKHLFLNYSLCVFCFNIVCLY